MEIKSKKITDISKRINDIIKQEGDTKNSFAIKLGYPRSQTVYDIVNARCLPSFDFFYRFANSEYAETYNTDWLLTGKGEKLRSKMKAYIPRSTELPFEEPSPAFLIDQTQKRNAVQIPLYNIEEAAGLERLLSNEHPAMAFISIPNLPACDGAVYISGDSMYPALRAGDIVMYKEVIDIKGIIWGETYLLSFKIGEDTYTMVRCLRKSEQGADFVTLVSENPQHESIDISLKAIRALAFVKASIRVNSMT